MDGRGAQIIQIAPKFVDEEVPRAFPCAAWRGDTRERCGVTPSRQWYKNCRFGHKRDVWLCGTHESMCLLNAGTCRECADRGNVVSIVWLTLAEP